MSRLDFESLLPEDMVEDASEPDPDLHRDSNPLDPVSWDQIKRAFLAGDMESIRKMYENTGMPVTQLGRRQA